jgi:gliding motility-associated-like protein
MRRKQQLLLLLFSALAIFSFKTSTAQLDSCSAGVPYFLVDLTGQPQGSWISPPHSRGGDCCGNNVCTSFEVILDSNAAALSLDFYSGAVPSGSMYFQIDCGPQHAVGELICLSGVGPHRITFCKPGNNQNEYIIQSIAKPTFPQDDSTRAGCSKDFQVLGFDLSTITWSSVFPGSPGDYDSLLSCTDSCDITTFTPRPNSPAFVDYVVCGFPQADECGYILTLCDTFRVYTMDSLAGSVIPNPASFCQLGPGSGVNLNASAIGGNGVYSYSWYDTSGTLVGTGPNYYATSQQTYTLEINDGLSSSKCVADYVGIPVTETSEPNVDAGLNQLLCPDVTGINLNGTITFASGGYWSGGNGTFSPDSSYLTCIYTPTPAEVTSGLLELYLTSTGAGGSCPNNTDTIQISFPPKIEINLSDTSVLCSDDSVTLSPGISGGIAPYNYLWSTGATTTTINAGAGNYCLNITDNLGCLKDTCINVTAPLPLSLSVGSTPATTNGGNDGSASATPSGGTGPYNYSWNPGGATTSTANGLSYGLYIVTVTDSNGCTIQGSVVVSEPRCLGFGVSVTSDSLLCFMDSSATATANVVGGSTPYTYLWDDPLAQTSPSITNLSAGLYTVAVTDSNGCIAVANTNILQPNPLVNVMNSTNASTVGGNDGSATANPFGGTAPYSYAWSNSGSTQTINGLIAGTYYVTITDSNGCSIQDSVIINEPPCNNFLLYVTGDNLTCNGTNDGAANVFIAGGVQPYSILWSNSSTSNTINNLSPNTYTVQVTDSNNCVSFKNITITEPNILNTSAIKNDISCYGLSDGFVDLTVTGGTSPYSYNWSNGATSEDIVNLLAGPYTVGVTDANGCAVSDSAYINEPTQINTSYTYQNVTCYGDSNATIDLTVNGGVMPYSYLWSTNDTTQDISNIPAGLYVVGVTDANNCNLSTSIQVLITQPEPVDLDSLYIQCPIPGDSLAVVSFFPTGGTSPYEISTDSGTTYMATGVYNTSLTIGTTYYIMINDSNGCTSLYYDTITINPGVQIDSINYDKCFPLGQSLSNVVVYPSGGAGGMFQVSFNNGTSYDSFGDYSDSLAINNSYYIIARDSLGCASLTDTIDVPDRLVASATVSSNFNGQDIACYGDTNGTALANQVGGLAPFAYAWDNGQNSQSAINLGAGTYVVQITDSNGCIDTASVILTEPDSMSNTITSTTNFNGFDISCYGATDGSIDLTPSGGTTPYTYTWSNSAISEDVSSVPAGNYWVEIVDINGCTDSAMITLSQPDSIDISAIIDHVKCNAYTDGSIDITVIGGVIPYTYLWSTTDTSQDVSSLGAGTYNVVVTDLNNCTATDTLTVQEESPLVLTTTQNNVSCNGLSDGIIDLTVAGGVLPYNYSWNTGDTIQDIDSLVAGIYYVLVTDSNNCFKNDTIQITEPDSLLATINSALYPNGHNISLWQYTDGSIDLEVFGGTMPYMYNWSNGATTQDLNGVGAGFYEVVIVDSNGCSYKTYIELTEPYDLAMPTVITVNGDGKNDVFLIHGLESYPNNTLIIFNRWGDQVYEMTNYDNNWNGQSSSGNDLPAGNYYVILNINNDEIILTGFVEIIR